MDSSSLRSHEDALYDVRFAIITRYMKNDFVSLSLVIPAYNEERFIGQCLDSIARQTVAPDEVIVVDNNCIDKTVDIATGYPFVRIVQATKQGIVHARNAGFDTAKSDLIGRIDADTRLPADWVENAKEAIAGREQEVIAATGPCNFMNLPLSSLMSRLHDVFYHGFSRVAVGRPVLFGSNMVLRRRAWRSVRAETCTSNDLHEDTDLSVHLGRHGRIVYDRRLFAYAHLRAPFLPPASHDYVKKWLKTLYHGRQIDKNIPSSNQTSQLIAAQGAHPMKLRPRRMLRRIYEKL